MGRGEPLGILSTTLLEMDATHSLVRLGVELGLAVNDYNSALTNNLDEVSKLTLAYLAAVKLCEEQGTITSKEIRNYFALIGQSWGSIQPRFDNEHLDALLKFLKLVDHFDKPQ